MLSLFHSMLCTKIVKCLRVIHVYRQWLLQKLNIRYVRKYIRVVNAKNFVFKKRREYDAFLYTRTVSNRLKKLDFHANRTDIYTLIFYFSIFRIVSIILSDDTFLSTYFSFFFFFVNLHSLCIYVNVSDAENREWEVFLIWEKKSL